MVKRPVIALTVLLCATLAASVNVEAQRIPDPLGPMTPPPEGAVTAAAVAPLLPEGVDFYLRTGGTPIRISTQDIRANGIRFDALPGGALIVDGRQWLPVVMRQRNAPPRQGYVQAGGPFAPVGRALGTPPMTLTPAPGSTSNISGVLDRFDRPNRMVILRDANGSTIEFALRDDTAIGSERVDDYFELHPGATPWRMGQALTISWRTSADGQKRVAVAVR